MSNVDSIDDDLGTSDSESINPKENGKSEGDTLYMLSSQQYCCLTYLSKHLPNDRLFHNRDKDKASAIAEEV